MANNQLIIRTISSIRYEIGEILSAFLIHNFSMSSKNNLVYLSVRVIKSTHSLIESLIVLSSISVIFIVVSTLYPRNLIVRTTISENK